MFRKLALTALFLSVAFLTGCDEPDPAPTPQAEHAADAADASKGGKPAFRHGVSARDGYKPRTDLCSIPPCGEAATPAKDEESKPAEPPAK